MRGKIGAGLGMMIEMVPVLIMVSAIAVGVFGISSTSYAYDISVRDVEARILGREVVGCLSSEGILNLDKIDLKERNKILSYCGIFNSERIYVGVDVFDLSGDEIASLHEGDSGKLWVRDLFEKAVLTGNSVSGLDNEDVKRIVKYNPGYFSSDYFLYIIEEGEKFEGSIKLEVLVNYEE